MKKIFFALAVMLLAFFVCLSACENENTTISEALISSIELISHITGAEGETESEDVSELTESSDCAENELSYIESGSVDDETGEISETSENDFSSDTNVFEKGEDYTSIFIKTPYFNKLVMLGAYSNGKLHDYSSLGIAKYEDYPISELLSGNKDERLTEEEGTENYDFQTGLVSVGDDLYLYSESSVTKVKCTRVYLHFYRGLFPWLIIETDSELDESQSYLSSNVPDLKTDVFEYGTEEIEYDLENDGIGETIKTEFFEQSDEGGYEVCYYRLSITSDTRNDVRVYGGYLPAIKNEAYMIYALCDIDRDGVYEIIDYHYSYDDYAFIRSAELDELIVWS